TLESDSPDTLLTLERHPRRSRVERLGREEEHVSVGRVERKRRAAQPFVDVETSEIAELVVRADQCCDRLSASEAGCAGDVVPFDLVELAAEQRGAVLSREWRRWWVTTEDLVEVVEVTVGVGDGDQDPAGTQHPADLGESPVEVRQVIQHPVRQDTVELG